MKKLFAALLTALLLMGGLAAFAQTPVEQMDQLPAEGSLCTVCGEGTLQQQETVYTPWVGVDTAVCEYNPRHLDSVMERTALYTWRCGSCRRGVRCTETETRCVHLHHRHYQARLRNGTL